jgi:hypothetical protein
MSRKKLEPSRADFEGWNRTELDAYHEAWRSWVAGIIEATAAATDFPTGTKTYGQEAI